ncbi:MAG: histidine kinase, partial [Dehalococcoidia bacterium]
MPRLSAASLGLKLNLTLFFFVLLLGSATAAFILYGFQRTQDNATNRSREGLEEIGRQQLQTIASDQADLGSFQLQWAADSSQMAARYLSEIKRQGGGVPFDASRLVRSESGVLYDPNPNRVSDVVMPNFAPLTPAAVQDIQETAALDALFPTILSKYPGQLRGTNFDAIAVTYSSVNQVTRYYPPIGINNIAAPDTDVSFSLMRLGPQNPERLTLWSVPYLDSAGQGLVITANTPVYDGDTFIGVIGVDLSITRLIATIDDVTPTQFGFAFYIDNNGKLLESDSFDTIQEELGRGNEQLRAVMQAMRRGEESVARITVNGQDMFVGYSPLAGIGGSFAVVASVDELTANAAAITASIDEEANRTLSITLIAMLAIFLVGLGGETWLNRKFILRPIEALVDGTRRVARGDLATTIPVRSDDELGILATSFNTMTEQMRARRDALEREVAERTAAQDELRALFNAMTDRVVVINRDGRLIRIAQTGGPRLLAEDDQVGQFVQEIRPAAVADITMNSVRQALETQQTVTVEFPFETPDGERWLSGAYSPLSDDSVVVVVRDITDFVGAQREVARQRDELQQEVRDRTAAQDELRALFAAMTELVIVADRDGRYLRIPETNAPPGMRELTAQQQAVIRPEEDDPYQERQMLQIAALREAIDEQHPVTIEYPTRVDDRELWMSATLSPISNQTAVIVARDITDRVNAQKELEQRVEERTRELNTVLEVSRNLVATLDLNTLLGVIMEQTEQVCSYSRASVYLYDQGAMALLGSRVPGGQLQTMPPSYRLQTDLMGTIWDDILGPEPSIIDDVHGDTPMAVALRAAVGPAATARGTQGIKSWMGVPLRLKDRVVGLLALTHEEAGFFTAHHYELVQAIANQAAVAIENAKLYEAAQQLAAVEERQKLARELHDSVSQALYGIALGAKTARTQLDRDPLKAIEPVDYVLQLAEAGLAEMRALIFELRPESLELEGLVAAMEKQVAATTARYGIKVSGDF